MICYLTHLHHVLDHTCALMITIMQHCHALLPGMAIVNHCMQTLTYAIWLHTGGLEAGYQDSWVALDSYRGPQRTCTRTHSHTQSLPPIFDFVPVLCSHCNPGTCTGYGNLFLPVCLSATLWWPLHFNFHVLSICFWVGESLCLVLFL